MVKSDKSSSIVNSFSTLLLEVWKKWDVRGMVLFSLTLQIVLSFLGGRRKYKINPFFKTILWFAYLGADWIAIATLGKLSSSSAESPATNVLRAYWAPLLLLHLGGPDTITAYSFEDNKLWIRHLLILVVKAIFVIYVVCLSWTSSWLSFLSLPLILAAIIKYVEKILCLKLNYSQKAKSAHATMLNLDVFCLILGNPQDKNLGNPQDENLGNPQDENLDKLKGYLYFIIMRRDVNDYLSSHNLSDVGIRIKTYFKETIDRDDTDVLRVFRISREQLKGSLFKVLDVELGLIFDIVYTKAALIYTKLGCFFGLISFASSFSVLLLFFINIINELQLHSSRIDLAITGILLSGAIALELYAARVMLSSDWAILVANFHNNSLLRKMLKVAYKCFPCLLHQSKRWSDQMGQFDLLKYCLHHKKRKANQSSGILRKITNCSEIVEMWHKYMFTTSVDIPSYLKREETYDELLDAVILNKSLKTSRGEKSLQKWQQLDKLKWSIDLDFDHSIIVWHLATSVCYIQEDDHDDDVELSKRVSDYMMYLLVMCPALLLSGHNKSFWLDHSYDKLKELLSCATDIRNAASKLDPDNIPKEELESSGIAWKNLQGDVFKLATLLKQSENNWEMIRDVWIEKLFFAAVSSQHISHVKQLGEGIEFLSLIWLLVGPTIIGSVSDTPEV